ncbi:MFS family permease [Chryseoglobus frigidaquae]|uniref:MFS family permease n=1 Tax=Microcella frigidaquae TaxID=424758 RepID=A0A840XLP0_9MICO|nr:MFS family permease [Microcella frigidaquae]
MARIIAAQLTARVPSGMLSLAFLIHIERIFDSYGAAGLVLAATSVGQAVAGPLTSRWMGRFGMRPVLIVTLIICAAGVFVIAFLLLPLWAYMLVGLIVGLATPPIQPAVRTIYPKMVSGRQLTPLFSLDASAQEIIWVTGPFITVVLATQFSPVAALSVAGAFMVGGGIWFIASPEVGKVRIPPSRRKLGMVLKNRAVVLSTVGGFLLIGSAASIEVGVVAVFGEGGTEAGILFGLWAIASLVGGLSMGHLPIGPWAMANRFAIVVVGMLLAPFALEFWWLALALIVAGIGIAPVLAVMFAIVSASVKFSETAEAYGWLGTGQLIGAALGSAIAGFLIDGFGAIGGFWAAIAFAVIGMLVAILFRGWHPDLRGRDASPLPDTEPVETVS